MAELKYKEITEKIIGCAMRAHAALGNGFQEVIYQRALAIEFRYAELIFEREFNMRVYYRNEQVGERRVDFLVAGKNYLEAYNVEVGLLINFGSTSLEFKRLENKKYSGAAAYPANP
jgi:hypothetical protein